MELYISNSGQEPIYAQITRQIKAKILNGELQQGDALPSIRLLAKELRISVITTDAARRGGITKDEVRETLDLLWEES